MSETITPYRAGHHPHGPSQIGNPCNANYKLSKDAPSLPASEDADEGTLLHALVANPDPAAIAALDEEQQRVVNACLAQAEAWADQLGDPRPHYEEWLELRDGDTLVNSGTLDYLAKTRTGTHGILGDWKTGRNASPLVADQLANYAAMAFQRWPTLVSIEAHAWYPRAPKLNQCWAYERSDLAGLVERIKARIAIRESRERWEFETGDHCTYCRAALICGARRRELAATEQTGLVTVESLAPAEIASLLPVLKRVEKISDAIKARAKALAGAGELPGYRLAEVRGREQLSSDAGAVHDALVAAGFDGACLAASQRYDLSLIRATAKAAGVSLDPLTPLVTRTAGYQKLVETKEK